MRVHLLIGSLVVAAGLADAKAAITITDRYTFDATTIPAIGNDSVGSNKIDGYTNAPSVASSTNVAPGVGSTGAISFTNGFAYDGAPFAPSNSAIAGVTTNYGVDVYVETTVPTTASDDIIFNLNTYGTLTGRLALDQVGNTYRASIVGTGYVGNAYTIGATPVYTNLAAIVTTNAANSALRDVAFYVNGTQLGSTFTTTVNGFNGFGLGGSQPGGQSYNGLEDNLNLFTFASGQFSPSDLQQFVPEPASLGLFAMTGLGLLRRRRRSV